MIIVVDNKPIFDHVHGEGVIVRDKRQAIDMLLIPIETSGRTTVPCVGLRPARC